MKIPYQEGDWFAIPLQDKSYVVGLVARMDRKGAILGYFFDTRWGALPQLEKLKELTASQAAFVRVFGDLALIKKEWYVLGRTSNWIRDNWPVPTFGRMAELDGSAWKVEYSDEDFSRPIRETAISIEECSKLPKDALLGARAVEGLLRRHFAGHGSSS